MSEGEVEHTLERSGSSCIFSVVCLPYPSTWERKGEQRAHTTRPHLRQ